MGAVGSYTRFIPNSADQDEFNQNVRRAHDGLDPINPRATAEQIKQVFEEARLADETRVTNKRNADEFCALHPEFLDHDKNGAQFNKTLDAMFGANIAYTVDQFERAYQVCCANNSLELDRAEIVKQQQAEANARAKAAHVRNVRQRQGSTPRLNSKRCLLRNCASLKTAQSKSETKRLLKKAGGINV